jgi:hypothetical protein
MLRNLSIFLVILVIGALGWLGMAGVSHLYTDHQNLHTLVTIEDARQRAVTQPPK